MTCAAAAIIRAVCHPSALRFVVVTNMPHVARRPRHQHHFHHDGDGNDVVDEGAAEQFLNPGDLFDSVQNVWRRRPRIIYQLKARALSGCGNAATGELSNFTHALGNQKSI